MKHDKFTKYESIREKVADLYFLALYSIYGFRSSSDTKNYLENEGKYYKDMRIESECDVESLGQRIKDGLEFHHFVIATTVGTKLYLDAVCHFYVEIELNEIKKEFDALRRRKIWFKRKIKKLW